MVAATDPCKDCLQCAYYPTREEEIALRDTAECRSIAYASTETEKTLVAVA